MASDPPHRFPSDRDDPSAWQRLRERGALLAYAALMRLSVPAYLARLWWRGRLEPGYRAHLGERLGLYRGPAPVPGCIWLHAVSLGEARAAQPLVLALRAAMPDLPLLLTHGTATGRAAGAVLLRPGDRQAWLPYDTPGAVRRFLRRHRPLVGLLMETEIWPVLLREAGRAGVPMVLANARLSERSARKGERMAALLHPAARRLSLALAQSVEDAERLRAAGVDPVMVAGNLKFDLTPSPELLQRGLDWRQRLGRPVVLGASTREGEEPQLLAAWRTLPAPRPLLVLVPRHPQRFEEVARAIGEAGFSLQRRSAWGARPPENAHMADVWLGDTLGEMPQYYALADVALLGGSFEPLGGQNLIEAAACGCPVVMGPHTFNFALASAKSLEAGAALRVADMAAGVAAAAALSRDGSRNAWVERALAFAASHRGAAALMTQQIGRLLGEHAGRPAPLR